MADGGTRESLPFADREVAERVGACSLLDAEVASYEVVERPGVAPRDPAGGGKLPPWPDPPPDPPRADRAAAEPGARPGESR
jgi:hypothetical protein